MSELTDTEKQWKRLSAADLAFLLGMRDGSDLLDAYQASSRGRGAATMADAECGLAKLAVRAPAAVADLPVFAEAGQIAERLVDLQLQQGLLKGDQRAISLAMRRYGLEAPREFNLHSPDLDDRPIVMPELEPERGEQGCRTSSLRPGDCSTET